MKYIQKTGPPRRYSDWRNKVRRSNKNDFQELPRIEKQALLNGLLREQGWICAYTMRRIDDESSHVEHIRPQSVCRAMLVGSDLDYDNLVACFPRENAPVKYRYGAQQKDDWWENGGADFVSPLHPACETRFRFNLNGEISAVGKAKAPVTTIRILKLDHPTLTEDRRRAIKEFIYGPNGSDPLTLKRARNVRESICQRNGDGHFWEFCVAIRNALDDYLTLLQKRAQKQKYARKG